MSFWNTRNTSSSQAYTSVGTWGYPEGMSIVDTLPDSLKPLIHRHWLNYPPVNPMWHYLLGTILILLGMANLAGNSLVIYLFTTKKSLRSPANMLIVSLSFADLMMMISQFPVVIYNCFNGGYWLFGQFGCEIYAFLGSLTGDAALLTLVAIGYDRYCVIVKTFDGGHMTRIKAFFLILFCWFYSGILAIWPFFGWNSYIPEGIMTSCSFDYLSEDWKTKSFGLFLFVMCYCVPLTFIIYFYSQIVNAIRMHERSLRVQAKKMNVENLRSNVDANKQSQEVRVAKVAVANVGLWLVTWTPYACIVMTGMFGDKTSITPLVSALPSLILKTASCYNPIMFAISHPKYRLALQETFPWFCIHEPKEEESKSVKTEKAESGN